MEWRGLQNGLKCGGTVHIRRAHPFKQSTPTQLSPMSPSLKDASKDKPFWPDGESNHLSSFTREDLSMGDCRLTTCVSPQTNDGVPTYQHNGVPIISCGYSK